MLSCSHCFDEYFAVECWEKSNNVLVSFLLNYEVEGAVFRAKREDALYKYRFDEAEMQNLAGREKARTTMLHAYQFFWTQSCVPSN